METVLRRVAALLPVAVFLAVYLPRVGHGFILDDYRWVLFYRPVVALTLGLDHALAGIEPLC